MTIVHVLLALLVGYITGRYMMIKNIHPLYHPCPHINTIDQGPDGVLCTDCGETVTP